MSDLLIANPVLVVHINFLIKQKVWDDIYFIKENSSCIKHEAILSFPNTSPKNVFVTLVFQGIRQLSSRQVEWKLYVMGSYYTYQDTLKLFNIMASMKMSLIVLLKQK